MNKINILKYFMIAFFFICVSSSISIADPLQVQILDSYYHIYGGYDFYAPEDYENFDEYENSSDTPISDSVSFMNIYGDAYAESQASEFAVSTSVANAGGIGETFVYALAEAAWVLEAVNDIDQVHMGLDIGIWGQIEINIILEDLTTGDELLNYYWNFNEDPWYLDDFYDLPNITVIDDENITINYDFTSGHLYALGLNVYSAVGPMDYSNAAISMDISSVPAIPEPITILLLGSGLAGLAVLGNKARKKKTNT